MIFLTTDSNLKTERKNYAERELVFGATLNYCSTQGNFWEWIGSDNGVFQKKIGDTLKMDRVNYDNWEVYYDNWGLHYEDYGLHYDNWRLDYDNWGLDYDNYGVTFEKLWATLR
jgi:hypothetical protein